MIPSGGVAAAAMVLAGVGIPVMAMLNGAFGGRFGPASAAIATFAMALLCAVVTAVAQGDQPVRAVAAAPWYMVLPGVIVAYYMLSITTLGPVIGLGTAVILVVLGQVLSAVILDHLGLFGMPQVPITLARLAGIVLIVIGVALARG
ncbi:DMT family transporter [uncultured Roseovarius sp.]|uniref:DMT family transporter n=1 Tax=uncultured Roseovarius sp. TaxID=293344 RepID=UPI0026186904|nr:DMT family transporter [uncultured Roseovarius sp.]